MKRKNKTADNTLTCGECGSATIEARWLSHEKNKPFCVWCKKDGRLKMMKWTCEYGKIKHNN